MKFNLYWVWIITIAVFFFTLPNGSFAESFFLFPVSNKTINIDGNFDDWTVTELIYRDSDVPDCGNAPGQDIRDVYLSEDSLFVYIRFVLNGLLDESFGYKFGICDKYVFVSKTNGQSYIYFDSPTMQSSNFPNIPNTFVRIVNNQFEAKISKTLIPEWKYNGLSAWCDQGTNTICRDSVSLGESSGTNKLQWIVSLKDVISVLQILAGIPGPQFDIAVNTDNKIGMEEAVFYLQVIAKTKQNYLSHIQSKIWTLNGERGEKILYQVFLRDNFGKVVNNAHVWGIYPNGEQLDFVQNINGWYEPLFSELPDPDDPQSFGCYKSYASYGGVQISVDHFLESMVLPLPTNFKIEPFPIERDQPFSVTWDNVPGANTYNIHIDKISNEIIYLSPFSSEPIADVPSSIWNTIISGEKYIIDLSSDNGINPSASSHIRFTFTAP
ncbi:Uncharacterized protein dnl_62120 [Desulfonema limicola]|uniref:Uncharacterized protein n=1 Tax=Desulfonema limicola TaxID=45656 RepID=A0A975BEB6_9BACT|nr:hypothetical protein [Desulfonema limicola]QTA83796.1 Uncharacterized protein dnl_62120 [Desulfonema limicola]